MDSPDRVTHRFLAEAGDGMAGEDFVSGGRLLEWIDKAAYACAVGWSGRYCTTAYVGNVSFGHPVRPGELVEVTARLIQTGATSMHVLVSVLSRDPASGRDWAAAVHCLAVMVAVDAQGQPIEVPQWEPSRVSELDLPELVSERVVLRRRIHEAMLAAPYTEAGTAPRTTMRFLATPTDANFAHRVYGGTVMRWIDEAAYATAAAWAGAAAVAVYAGGIQFSAPIAVGDLVEVESRLIHTTEHAMHLGIEVRSAPVAAPDRRVQNVRCIAIFAVPQGGRAAAVPQWTPASEEDAALDAHAQELVALRARIPALPQSLLSPV